MFVRWSVIIFSGGKLHRSTYLYVPWFLSSTSPSRNINTLAFVTARSSSPSLDPVQINIPLSKYTPRRRDTHIYFLIYLRDSTLWYLFCERSEGGRVAMRRGQKVLFNSVCKEFTCIILKKCRMLHSRLFVLQGVSLLLPE